MPVEAVLIKIEDNDGAAAAIDRAADEMDAAGGELVLDLSAVRRIDSAALRAMENLLRTAAEKQNKVSLTGVDVAVYKVLKLMKLAGRVSFMNS
jgi:anti-anti-sigma regulatory factor